jgi:tyrosinase
MTVFLDPVFFLHHTQLDRMWWQWQVRHKFKKQGLHKDDFIKEEFHFEGFAPDRKMSEIMSTESDLLCYRY